MKQHFIALVCMLVSVMCVSCQKQETHITPATVTVLTQPQPSGEPATEGYRKVTIAATADWTATSDVGWLTVSPFSGGKGIQEVTLHFQSNGTNKYRTGTITFKSGGRSETFTLTQQR